MAWRVLGAVDSALRFTTPQGKVRMAAQTIQAKWLPGAPAWISSLLAMSRKELTIMVRYPVEFVASFGQIFLIVIVLTLAGLMFSPNGVQRSAGGSRRSSGVVVYGFILFMFLSDTLWTIGYNVRREQKQGTLEQLYLSPASKSASLVSRVTVTLVWTGLLSVASAALMIMMLCAPFFPFSALPEWIQNISRLIPMSYAVDSFRSTLMGYPEGFPELASIEVEVVIVAAFGLLMPVLGLWLYRREENRARRTGSLSEY